MDGSRLLAAFSKVVELVVARVDYHALYPATVVKQNADGTLDVTPESTKLGPLGSVPIRLGLPGSTVKVTSGRVLLGFENGNPDRPVALLWDTASVDEIALAGGSGTVLRSGDTIALGGLTMSVVPGGPGSAVATGTISLVPATPASKVKA